jgi:hypothetical protein
MYFTSDKRVDGFGSQFQTLLHIIYYSSVNNAEYIHIPIQTIEHNYLNDPQYVKTLEEFMCVKMFKSIHDIDTSCTSNVRNITSAECRNYFQEDVNRAMSHISLVTYKSTFWNNINENHYNNNKFNISIHIRRGDVQPNYNSDRYTSNQFYLTQMQHLSEKYKDRDILFHIYSEGLESEFECFKTQNTVLHLNEDVKTTFIGLITSDVLVQSKSSFSYVAGLLSKGIIYHIPFWHPPLSSWILI